MTRDELETLVALLDQFRADPRVSHSDAEDARMVRNAVRHIAEHAA